jgi:hypothetical protein
MVVRLNGKGSCGRYDGVIVTRAGEPEDGATPFSTAESGWHLSFLQYGVGWWKRWDHIGCVGMWRWGDGGGIQVGSRGNDTRNDISTDVGTPRDETAGSKRGRKKKLGEPQTERALAPACAAEDPQTAPLATRQERALALLCQGLRPSAIAQILGTPPGTVHRWLRKHFDGLAREAREEHASALLRAIESQREIVRAAWEAYQHERAVEAAALRGELDRVKRRAGGAPDGRLAQRARTLGQSGSGRGQGGGR